MVNVLIVDSDDIYSQMLRNGLEGDDCTVAVSGQAQTAVDELDINGADIIILELVLNENNGLTLLQHLRSYSDWQQIPVIVLTQLGEDRVQLSDEQWQQYGVVECIHKTELDLSHLQQLIMDTTADAARAS